MIHSASSSSVRRVFTTVVAPRRSCLVSAAGVSLTISRSVLRPSASESPFVTPVISHPTQPYQAPLRRLLHSSPSSRQGAADVSADASEEKPQEMSSGEADIHALLKKRFDPTHLQVQDVSGGCGSFYAIVVASKEFQGLTTVKQHRMVNECLKDIIGGIHGLQLKTIAAD